MDHLQSSLFALLASSSISYASSRDISNYFLQKVNVPDSKRENVPHPDKQNLHVGSDPFVLPRRYKFSLELIDQENSLPHEYGYHAIKKDRNVDLGLSLDEPKYSPTKQFRNKFPRKCNDNPQFHAIRSRSLRSAR